MRPSTTHHETRMPASPSRPGAVAVYGATGHTGAFVLAELARRGMSAVAVGRRAATPRTPVPVRIAALDAPHALVDAFAGCAVVVNAAGPFLDTATPVLEAALAAGCHYIDVTAEQASARDTLARFDAPARERGLAVMPAAGFYGGLADLLASALAGDGAIDAITVSVALDRWWPTAGTRLTGARNTHPRVVVDDGRLIPMPMPAQACDRDFGAPEGRIAMVEVPLSETIALHHHLPARAVRSYLSANALADLRDPGTAPPVADDALGRSAQRFTLQVALADARGTRRATARGRDIYAVSAPLVVEAAARLLAPGHGVAGATTLGAAFDARDVLRALSPMHLEVEMDPLPPTDAPGTR